MTSPAAPSPPSRPPTDHPDHEHEHHAVLEAFNAEGVVDHPDDPTAEPGDTPADDAAAPPP